MMAKASTKTSTPIPSTFESLGKRLAAVFKPRFEAVDKKVADLDNRMSAVETAISAPPTDPFEAFLKGVEEGMK